jgi:hypothetical protein
VTDRPHTAAVATLVALTVCACGTPDAGRRNGSLPAPTVPTAPGQTFELPPPPPPVSWADDGEHLAVTTWGSWSCPTAPTDVHVVGDQELRVDIEPLFPDRDPCTADAAMRTTEVELPDDVSADEPVTVHLDHGHDEEETVVLPPAGE